jgi:hypothetical protein
MTYTGYGIGHVTMSMDCISGPRGDDWQSPPKHNSLLADHTKLDAADDWSLTPHLQFHRKMRIESGVTNCETIGGSGAQIRKFVACVLRRGRVIVVVCALQLHTCIDCVTLDTCERRLSALLQGCHTLAQVGRAIQCSLHICFAA